MIRRYNINKHNYNTNMHTKFTNINRNVDEEHRDGIKHNLMMKYK
jgi:hypothetical protein